MDSTMWQQQADKIIQMLTDDASMRQQSITLLDALADSVGAAGAGSAFIEIFSQSNTIEATFGWMKDLSDELSWGARRDFEKENIFWPLYDIMLRIYPDRAMNLPPLFAMGKCKRIPVFLSKPNSVRHLVIVDGLSLDRLHLLNEIDSVSFNMSTWDFERLDWSEVDLSTVEEGMGSFRLLGPERNNLVFDEVNGQRSLRIATGVFVQDRSYSFDAYKNLQVSNLTLSQIVESWTQQTPHNFLDLGIAHLHLSEDVSLTIAERLTSIHLQTVTGGWSDETEHILNTLFEGQHFPRLTAITSQLGWNYVGPHSLIISSELLQRMPSLKTIYLNVSDVEWNVTFKECESLVHPLSTVVVSENDQITFYLFDSSIKSSLQSRLQAVSIGCNDVDFLTGKDSERRAFLLGASHVHLFHTEGNLSMIRHFTTLKEFYVERDPYLVRQVLTGLLPPEASQTVQNIGDVPLNIVELTKRTATPLVGTTSGIRVGSLSDLQFYYGGKEPYTLTAVFLQELRRCSAEQSFPELFVSWLRAKGMVRIGRYCAWVNNADVVRMKAYSTWGSHYLDHVKTYGGTLNLERVLFGLPQGVSNLLPLSMKSIRYNDPAIPLAGLLTISNLVELYVEIPVDVEEVCTLQNLEVLYLNDLGLTSLPDDIGDLTSLRELHLWGNKLNTLPDSISKLKNLRLINISANAFATIPRSLLSLPNIQRVIWRGGTEEWERMVEVDSAFAQRVEDGELVLHDADLC